MPNPFNSQNTNSNVQMQNIYKMLTQSNNPIQLFQQIASKNPSMQPVLDMLKTKNPEEVFRIICNQRGVDPQQFIKSITG